MAAPLSGIGGQQVPLSQPFQPGGSDQSREIRQKSQEPRETELQAPGAAPAQSQSTNTEKQHGGHSVGIQSASENSAQPRGSVVDIIV